MSDRNKPASPLVLIAFVLVALGALAWIWTEDWRVGLTGAVLGLLWLFVVPTISKPKS